MAKAKSTSSAGGYLCLSVIFHDGSVYEPGSFIDLSAEQAESLLLSKAIKSVGSIKAEDK